MTGSRAPRRVLSVFALVVASVIAFTGLSSGAAVAASTRSAVTCAPPAGAPAEGGVEMTATIIGPGTSPCDQAPGGGTTPGGAASGAGGSTGPRSSGSAGSSSAGTTGPGGVDTTTETTPQISIDEVDLGGVLHVGGLLSSYQPSLNPFGGDLELAFTVRNVSKSTVEATADFWMEGPFGNRISSADGVRVAELKPGETRTVSASLPGVGQWTVLSAHATFTPPTVVDETELSPLTRDSTAFALPWFFVLLTTLGLAAWVIVRVVRSRDVAEPIGAFA